MTAARTGDRATALRLVLNGVDVNCSVGEVRVRTPSASRVSDDDVLRCYF